MTGFSLPPVPLWPLPAPSLLCLLLALFWGALSAVGHGPLRGRAAVRGDRRCRPESLTPAMRSAACRMAATRSKARVLRDALNVGVCSFEELPSLVERSEPERGFPEWEAPQEPAANGHKPKLEPRTCEECGQVLTPAQATYSLRKHGQALCPEHQNTAAAA